MGRCHDRRCSRGPRPRAAAPTARAPRRSRPAACASFGGGTRRPFSPFGILAEVLRDEEARAAGDHVVHDDLDRVEHRTVRRTDEHAPAEEQHLDVVVAHHAHARVRRALAVGRVGIRQIRRPVARHVPRVRIGRLAVDGDRNDLAVEAVERRCGGDQLGAVAAVLDDVVVVLRLRAGRTSASASAMTAHGLQSWIIRRRAQVTRPGVARIVWRIAR